MKVLLPTDGSEYSDAAAELIKRLGFGRDDEIFVLHVVKDYLLPDEVDRARDFKLAGIRGAKVFVKDFGARHFPEGFRVKTLVREGEPWQEIVSASEELGIELIAMGHRGLSGVKRFMLGSAVHKVVRHSAISVLIVREKIRVIGSFRVLFCTDGTGPSERAREFLMKMPLPDGAEVAAVSVVDMDVTSLPEVYYPEEDTSKMMADLREHFRKSAQNILDRDSAELAGRFGRIEERILFGNPDQEIINASAELDADLVVMGCRETKGISGALLGSASYRVMKHLDCSMLVAKSTQC